MKTDQGIRNLTEDESVKLSGQDPDSATRDLYTAIEKGNYPSWTVYAQVIDPLEAEVYKTNIFDATKTVSQKDYPLIPFGKITLNQNPINYFSEVEQSAFAPANLVPGWDVSFDPSMLPLRKYCVLRTNSLSVLQIRLFAYGDTQRYRLGVNLYDIPVNKPFYSYNPTRRDGVGNVTNYGSAPNYLPSDFQPKIIKPAQYEERAAHEEWIGTVVDFETHVTEDDFVQPREFWKVLGTQKDQQKNLVYNVAQDLSGAVKQVRYESYCTFSISFARELS
jgi:catalase